MRTHNRPALFLPLVLLLLGSLPFPATPAVPTSTDSAMAYLETLADPELFEGRKTGSAAGNASQRWIADHFAAWGLQPFIGDSFLHEFEMLVTEEDDAELRLLDTERYGDLDFLLGDDFTLTVNSGSGKVTAPVVVVGHGISEPGKGWDDYEDVDVDGKIVVILRGKPPVKENWDNEYSRSYLLPTAVERGAEAVLFYMGDDVIGGAAIMLKAYQEDIPSAVVGKRVIEHLFHGTGYTMDVYKRMLKQGPRPVELAKRMRIKADVDRIDPGVGYNVAGVIPGTDPTLRNEAIIVGGHGDHVGPNSLGHVYTGADDNGSGTSVVMELARSFAANPQPRTLVFMLFGAEEQGLLGSEAIVPDLPDTYDYVTMVNLDMAGRGEGITGIGGGNAVPETWFPWYASLPDSVQATIQGRRAWGGYSSDHAPFREAGIPSFTTYSRGSHDHYHRTDDRFFTIDRRAIGGALDALALWVEELASTPSPMAHPYQPERVVWHRGYGLTGADISGEIDADLEWAENRMREGYVGSVLRIDGPAGEGEWQLFFDLLDSYRDEVRQREALDLADELKSFRGNAYSLRGTVYLAAEGDGFTDADSTRLEMAHALGLSWITLRDRNRWVHGDSLTADHGHLVQTMNTLGLVVEIPMDHASTWMPLVSSAGTVLVHGSWDDWTGLSDVTLESLQDAGARFWLNVPHRQLGDAVAQREKLAEFDVHVQPVSDNYDETLAWMRLAVEQGLEDDELLEWIGGHAGRW